MSDGNVFIYYTQVSVFSEDCSAVVCKGYKWKRINFVNSHSSSFSENVYIIIILETVMFGTTVNLITCDYFRSKVCLNVMITL